MLSLCGVYPQYRAIRTVLTGLGLMSGDSWEENRKVNLKLSMIEPVAEGMFQLICQCIILYIVNGPGESSNDGKGVSFVPQPTLDVYNSENGSWWGRENKDNGENRENVNNDVSH